MYLLAKNFFGDDGSKNISVYQPPLNRLEWKIDKSTDYVIGCRSKGVYNSKLLALQEVISPIINYFTRKIEIQFNNTSLVVEQNNYATKIVNAYI